MSLFLTERTEAAQQDQNPETTGGAVSLTLTTGERISGLVDYARIGEGTLCIWPWVHELQHSVGVDGQPRWHRTGNVVFDDDPVYINPGHVVTARHSTRKDVR
jgi:hypothetical protein